MKLIIAGGRDFEDYDLLCLVMRRLYPDPATVTAVVCGYAYGADLLGKRWANEHHVEVLPFLPNYQRYPKKVAPFVRNWEMAYAGDELVAFHDGVSNGTQHMMDVMNSLGKPVWSRMYQPIKNRGKVRLDMQPDVKTATDSLFPT